MIRKKEFEAYLKTKFSITTVNCYISYCNKIEEAFGGIDMDEIIISHQKISEVRKKLNTLNPDENFVNKHMSGLNRYLEFSVLFIPTGLVTYENSVPGDKRIDGLCEFLEDEYEKIRDYAGDVLKNILQYFPAIPVYLSKECPSETYYYEKEFLLKKMSELCERCERRDCRPPYCQIAGVLEHYSPFKHNITGRFFGGAEPHIVIYFKNFDKPHNMNNQQYLAEIVKTLAHEYMHYLHYNYVTEGIFENTRKELKEAIADFFGVLYSMQRGDTVVVKKRYLLWKKLQATPWPYSNALKFLPKPHKNEITDYDPHEIKEAIEKFRDVFHASSDPTTAMTMLNK